MQWDEFNSHMRRHIHVVIIWSTRTLDFYPHFVSLRGPLYTKFCSNFHRLWLPSLLCYLQSVMEISLQSHRHGFTEPHQVILMIIGFICLSIPMWTLPTAVQVIHVRSIIRFIVLCAAGCQCSQVDGHSCWCHSCRYATVWSHQSFSFTSPVWLQMGSRSKEYIISPYTSSMNDRNVQELGQC